MKEPTPLLVPIPNHPECMRGYVTVWGPCEDRDRLIIVKERGTWVWRYKRANESQYSYVGPVSRVKDIAQRIRMIKSLNGIL